MKKGVLSGAAYVVAASSLLIATPILSDAQTRESEAQERRRHIRYMEGVLAQAVLGGAEEVNRELQRQEPTGTSVLLGTPRARGFVIEGHGIFFDVEVPDMDSSFVTSVMVAQRDRQVGNALDSLRSAVRTMPEGPQAQQVQMALQLLDSTVGPRDSTDAPAGGRVAAATILTDPRTVYRKAVIGSIVDAMLGYSVQMSVGPDEWLTVAARGIDTPISPLQGLRDSTTIIVRVKGSDLAIYHSDPTRRAEISDKVKADAKVF